jgi:hypothetical protein
MYTQAPGSSMVLLADRESECLCSCGRSEYGDDEVADVMAITSLDHTGDCSFGSCLNTGTSAKH